MHPGEEDVKVESEEFFPMDTEPGNYGIMNFHVLILCFRHYLDFITALMFHF